MIFLTFEKAFRRYSRAPRILHFGKKVLRLIRKFSRGFPQGSSKTFLGIGGHHLGFTAIGVLTPIKFRGFGAF